MDQRTTADEQPPFKAVMKQKARGLADVAGTSDEYVDNWKISTTQMGDANYGWSRYGIVSGAGKAIITVTQAAAVASSFGSSLRFQRLFGNSLAGDRGADSIAATILRA